MNRSIDVLAIGDGNIDLVIKVPFLPSFDQKVLGKWVDYYPGGTVANFACAASQLGLRVASLSSIGEDDHAQRILEGFKQFGVDTSYIGVRKGEVSHFAVIMLDPSGEKSLIFVPTFEEHYDLNQAAEIMPKTRMIYTMPRASETFFSLANLAHKHGTQVMIDIEATVCQERSLLERLLKHTDIACFNQEGFETATGNSLSPDTVGELLSLGPRIIVITRGSKGAMAVDKNDWVDIPAFQVPIVDTTGAGDTFNAAFLTATLQNQSLRDSLCFASATAAISVSAVGARGHLPDIREVRRFLQQHLE